MRRLLFVVSLATALSLAAIIVPHRQELYEIPKDTLLKRIGEASVQVNGVCTGSVISKGYVLTASHCVVNKMNADPFVDHKGKRVMMIVVHLNETENVDLALLKGPEIGIPLPVRPRQWKQFEEGLIVGYPLGVRVPIVTTTYYAGKEETPFGQFDSYTALVAPGNSGSGIYTMDGELNGVALRAFRPISPVVMSVTNENLQNFLDNARLTGAYND